MASLYIAITPIPNGVYNLQPIGTHNNVFAFKIGDSTDMNGRRRTYRTDNPDVSFCTVPITNWAPAGVTGTAYDNNVRGSTTIDNRVAGWFAGQTPNRPIQTGIGKIAEKCIFGPNYGRMPNSQEWYIITGNLANWLAQEFPDNTTRTAFPNMASFINFVFQQVNPTGL